MRSFNISFFSVLAGRVGWVHFPDHFQVFEKEQEISEDKQYGNKDAQEVEESHFKGKNTYQRIAVDEKKCSISDDGKKPDLRRADFAIGDLEYPPEVRVDVRADGQHKISDDDQQGHRHMHERGEAQAQADDQNGNGIYIVVHIKAVQRPFDLAEPCQASVQTVSEPVDQESQGSQPQKTIPVMTKKISQSGHERTHDTDPGQMVGRDFHRQNTYKKVKEFFFDPPEERFRDPFRFFLWFCIPAHIARI